MATVGVRELKARLSEYLRRAHAGERVMVTDRGEVIASIGPAEEAAPPAWVARLIAEGRAKWSGVKPSDVGMHPRIKTKGGASLSQAVIEDRR